MFVSLTGLFEWHKAVESEKPLIFWLGGRNPSDGSWCPWSASSEQELYALVSRIASLIQHSILALHRCITPSCSERCSAPGAKTKLLTNVFDV